MPYKIKANDSFKIFLFFYKKIRLDISCLPEYLFVCLFFFVVVVFFFFFFFLNFSDTLTP